MRNDPVPPASEDDLDRLLDNPFGMGPFSRAFQAGDWWVITGMHVRLPEALAGRPVTVRKLLVFADMISMSGVRHRPIAFGSLTDVLLISQSLNMRENVYAKTDVLRRNRNFRMTVFSRNPTPGKALFLSVISTDSMSLGKTTQHRWSPHDFRTPVQFEFRFVPGPYDQYGRGQGENTESRSPMPHSGPGFDACREFLERILLTAQSLFDAGRADEANRTLARLDTLLGLVPGVAAWKEIPVQSAATREMLLPQLPGSERVPALSPTVYDGVARSYGKALETFSAQFDRFIDRTVDIKHRKLAASLMLKKEEGALRFQALVTEQLDKNLGAATDSLERAQQSMTLQSKRVEEAEGVFQNGLTAWKDAQQRRANLAIASAVFSAVVAIGKIVGGAPPDLADLEKKVQAGKKLAKIVLTLKKLDKIIKTVLALVKMVRQILPAVNRGISAATLAARMADVRREADESSFDGAPSAAAYWDQFREEIDAALAPVAAMGIPGAAEYLRQLRVMIIYGRTLTAAQAAIVPIAQELAQADLLTKLARDQHDAITKQIKALKADAPSSMLVAALWNRHRAVRRAVFAALEDFDAAHRYWALSDADPSDPGEPMEDLAGQLLKVADMKESVRQALESFSPSPQDFIGEKFKVPDADVADFLRNGSFRVRFTPELGPLAGWGDVGRVRVHEIAAWIIWRDTRSDGTQKDKRPEMMEFIITTDGDYFDQRVVSRKVKTFRFLGPRIDRKFRYRVKKDGSTRGTITVPARVAEDFRAQYSEPTLFAGWQFSLPRKKGAVDPAMLKMLRRTVEGIELEFSGTFIKAP